LGRLQLIAKETEHAITRDLKRHHFSERTLEAILASAQTLMPTSQVSCLASQFESHFIDSKRRDYALLIEAIINDPRRTYSGPKWNSIKTLKWDPQFEIEKVDLPSLDRW
jgi:hypothetical protein